jgi:hypothetical protein
MAKALMIIGSVAILFFIVVFAMAGKTVDNATKAASSCSLNTRIDFLKINDQVQACYKDNSIYFAVENLGSDTISGLSVYLESGFNLTMLVKGSISPGAAKQQSLNFGPQSIADVKSMTLYPVVGESREVCADAGVKAVLEKC